MFAYKLYSYIYTHIYIYINSFEYGLVLNLEVDNNLFDKTTPEPRFFNNHGIVGSIHGKTLEISAPPFQGETRKDSMLVIRSLQELSILAFPKTSELKR